VFLFLTSPSTELRLLALLVVAAPAILLTVTQSWTTIVMRQHKDADGNFIQFPNEPLRSVEKAIAQNDVAAIAALPRGTDLNVRSIGKLTPLTMALEEMEEHPDRIAMVRALLAAGADPNFVGNELPLEMAISLTRRAGPDVMNALLEAGARVNQVGEFGMPAFFIGGGSGIDRKVTQALLDRGADLKAVDDEGRNAVWFAASAQNWPATLLLMQRGADWRSVRTLQGLGFLEMLEADARTFGDGKGLAEVIAFVRAAK
jgi:ankyrin repeat protein